MDLVVGTEFNKANAGRAKSEIEKIIQRNAKYVPNKGAVANMKEFFDKELKVTKSKKGPNYHQLPAKDIGKHSGIKNYTTSPLFTK